jgi:hypothetical protein
MPDSRQIPPTKRVQSMQPFRLTVLVQPIERLGRIAHARQIARFARTEHSGRIERARLMARVLRTAHARQKELVRHSLPIDHKV